MENNKGYVYVCRKCEKIYTNDVFKGEECVKCKEKLERLPISLDEWKKLSEDDKERYKKSYLSQVEPIGNKYVYKSTTPLAWHQFTRYVRCPLAIIVTLGSVVGNGYYFGSLTSIILIIIFLLGSTTWEKYTPKAIIANDVIAIASLFIVLVLSQSPYALGYFLSQSIVGALEIKYYLKREKLFNGSKDDFSLKFEFKPSNIENTTVMEENKQEEKIIMDNIAKEDIAKTNNELEEKQIRQDNEKKELKVKPTTIKKTTIQEPEIKPSVDIKFCRKCGMKLSEDVKFCRNCGTKIK